MLVIEPIGGPDAEDFVETLRRMYASWKGPVRGEHGVHRLVQVSPHDPQRRRSSSLALVRVDGETTNALVRTYVTSPYQLVHDHRSGRRTEAVERVFGGDLSLVR
jgi:protein subunit release factor B